MRQTIHDSSDFGRVLREHRKFRRLTQRQAADLCGVSARLWSESETGKRSQVALETALRMMQTVGVDLTAVPRADRSTKRES